MKKPSIPSQQSLIEQRLVPVPRIVRVGQGVTSFRWHGRIVSLSVYTENPVFRAEFQRFSRLVMPPHVRVIMSRQGPDPARPAIKQIPVVLELRSVTEAPHVVGPQAYKLVFETHRIVLSAKKPEGLRYGMITLCRLLATPEAMQRELVIRDWPDFVARGVMLDVSRDKAPTLATLSKLIRQFALLKINQLQLYFEHTFAYKGHEEVWRDASAYTPAEVRKLDRLCQEYGIELVPNQNTLGHMERWLKHPRYAPLAEYDGPYKTPWGDVRTTPTTLNPTDPRSVRLVSSLLDQLLPNFASKTLNIGCDEPLELGQGKSRIVCHTRGAGRVFLDYVSQVRCAAKRRGCCIQIWSDWVLRDPKNISRLMREVSLLVWGYEADHPFEDECRKTVQRRRKVYVCPGTSSWCSFAGRTENMIANLTRAAAAGRKHGARGFLLTDWGDYGHRQYLPVSYAAFVFGAALSWCAQTNECLDIGNAVSREMFEDATGKLADAWLAAGRVHEASGVSLKNKTILFAAMQTRLSGVAALPPVPERAIEEMLQLIDWIRRMAKSSRPKCEDARLVLDELNTTLAVLQHACLRMRFARLPAGERARSSLRAKLRRQIRNIISRHRQLWRRRNRPGGLNDSLAYYQHLLHDYR